MEEPLASSSALPDLSVVIPALNEGEHLRRTVESALATVPRAEIIVVDDGSRDGCADFLRGGDFPVTLLEPGPGGQRLGAGQARNKGARVARANRIVFADAHVAFPPRWAEELCDALENPSVGAAAPAVSVLGRPESKGFGLRWNNAQLGIEWLPPQTGRRYAVPLLAGICFAVRRDVLEECGGFDDGLVRWGHEDAELSIRIWSHGYDLCLIPGVEVAHFFREQHPYVIDWADLLYNTLRVGWIHFAPLRLASMIEALKRDAQFGASMARIAASDAGRVRASFQARRARNDDSYFHRFGDIV